MGRIPLSLPADVQQALRTVWSVLGPLDGSSMVDLKGRRVAAGDAVDQSELVTLRQVRGLVPPAAVQSPPKIGGALNGGLVRIGTFATRGLAGAHGYSVFLANDRNYVTWVSDGVAWKYVTGAQRGVIASLTGSLTTDDAGYLYYATDYARAFRWTGSAWENAPGEDAQGEIRFFAIAPSTGWQLCDGTTTTRSTSAGSTAAVTVPNYSTSAYLKAATSLTAGPTAASGTTADESAHTHSVDPPNTTSGNDSGSGTVVQSGTGTTVATHTHTHDTNIGSFASAAGSAHNHAPGTLELRRTELLAYYRL